MLIFDIHKQMFYKSRTKNLVVPNRAIDEIQEQKHKDGLVVRIVTATLLCDLESTLLKLVLERSNVNVTAVNPAV